MHITEKLLGMLTAIIDAVRSFTPDQAEQQVAEDVGAVMDTFIADIDAAVGFVDESTVALSKVTIDAFVEKANGIYIHLRGGEMPSARAVMRELRASTLILPTLDDLAANAEVDLDAMDADALREYAKTNDIKVGQVRKPDKLRAIIREELSAREQAAGEAEDEVFVLDAMDRQALIEFAARHAIVDAAALQPLADDAIREAIVSAIVNDIDLSGWDDDALIVLASDLGVDLSDADDGEAMANAIVAALSSDPFPFDALDEAELVAYADKVGVDPAGFDGDDMAVDLCAAILSDVDLDAWSLDDLVGLAGHVGIEGADQVTTVESLANVIRENLKAAIGTE